MNVMVEWQVLSPEVIQRVKNVEAFGKSFTLTDTFDFAQRTRIQASEVKGSPWVRLESDYFSFTDPVKVAEAKAELQKRVKGTGPN